MMFVEIFLIGFLVNIWHCQGEENPLTKDEIINLDLSTALANKLTAQEKFSTINGLIFTEVPLNNQHGNHHPTFGGKHLESSGGPFQLNYFTPNDPLLSRNHAPVSINTENFHQPSQMKPPPNSYPITPISYFFLPPRPNPGPPFLPQPKYSRPYLTLYPKPYLRSISEYVILRVSPRLNSKPPFNTITSQRDGPNQVARKEYFYRPSPMLSNLIHQKQDVANSEQPLRNKFIELNNQAFTARQNSVYSQSIDPFLMKIIQLSRRNNRAKKHISFYPHSNFISNNNSSIENCQDCKHLISIYSTPKPENKHLSISPMSNTINKTSKIDGTMMVLNVTVKGMLLAGNNSTSNERTYMNSSNMTSVNDITVSTENVIPTTTDWNYGQTIPADDILKINDEISVTTSSTEIIVVADPAKSTLD